MQQPTSECCYPEYACPEPTRESSSSTLTRAARLQATAALAVLLLALLPAGARALYLGCPATSPCCADRFTTLNETFDVQYGSANGLAGGTVTLLLDKFEAQDDVSAARPVMILLHGGAFMPGSTKAADNTREEARAWARRGFLALAIEYRRWNGLTGPTDLRILVHPMHDTLAAVRYVVANSGALRADPNNIGLSGTSAGAITVAHVTALDKGEGSSGSPNFPSNVSIAIARSGGISTYLYGEPEKAVADIPVYFAVHSTGDRTVPYEQAVSTKNLLDSLGTPNDLYTRAGKVHTPNPFTTPGRDNELLFDDMVGLAVRHMSIPACLITQEDLDEESLTPPPPTPAGAAGRGPQFLLVALLVAATVAVCRA
jgi:hypothetical protein